MARRRLISLAAVATACLAMAGCGSGSSTAGSPGAAAVKQAVHQLLADLGSANGRGFCALASAPARAQLSRIVPHRSCAQTITALAADLPAARRRALLHARLERVVIQGSVAVVRAADITTTQGTLKGFLSDTVAPTRLRRQADGSWRFAS